MFTHLIFSTLATIENFLQMKFSIFCMSYLTTLLTMHDLLLCIIIHNSFSLTLNNAYALNCVTIVHPHSSYKFITNPQLLLSVENHFKCYIVLCGELFRASDS